MRARTLINEDYSVGIICALEVEMAAVRVALDEEHRQPTMVRETTEDYAGYVFGRIGAHNVVINVMRKASAATVANLMMRRFPIKIGLMVGVGGGVWSDSSERDIRLGDVVVSQPEGSHGGVVLGEMLGGHGKTDSVSRFRRTGILERPPQPLLDAVQSLERRTASEDSRVRAHLEAMDAKSSLVRHGAGHPGQEHDELFEASCEHIGGDTCADCDRSRLVRNRPRRTDNNPRVHHGLIASCNAAVKDGLTRDRIAREEGVICFETTAAGLMATFPCVVIRGICDYADSHRNHRWQVYAAAVAAAYAKEVLLWMSAADLAPERWASEVTGMQVVHIPLSKNRQFVGRRAELEILKRRIFEAPECQRLAVFGPSGIGKTQLALSFAYWVAEQHPEISVFWIAAPSADAFERAVQKIAQQLWLLSAADQSEDGKDLLKLHLSTSSTGKWLLIVDNADDAEIFKASTRSDSLLRYLPESPLGVTVFTTRSSSVAHHLAGKETLELKEMTSDEAAELLEAVIVDAESLKDPVANAKFLAELGHMPLVVKQAAAYINDPKLSVSDFSRISRSAGFAFSSALDNMNQTAQRRPRRNVAHYAYPVADISTVQYALDGIDSPPTSSAPGDFSPSVESAMKPTRLRRIRPCYLMCALGFLAIGGSLAVGLFYSIAQDRMGDGFTTAGWMVAVSTLMLAAPMAKHYPNCRCWDSHEYAVL